MTPDANPTTTAPTFVESSVTVSVPIERAWAAFTGEFTAWWPRDHHIGEADMAEAIIEPRSGGRWFERGVDGSECDWGRVLVWDPSTHLALSWHLDSEFRYDPDPDRCSQVDIRFTAVDGGTEVVLTHSGLDRHGAGWEQLATGVGNGWPGIIDGFARLLDA